MKNSWHLRITYILTVLIALTIVASFGTKIDKVGAYAIDANGIPVMTYYNQCDSRWGSNTMNPGTICNSGCGPTALAMVLKYYNVNVTPADTANVCLTWMSTCRIAGGGTTQEGLARVAKEYGLQASSGISWDRVIWLISRSRPVVVSVGSGGGSLFTSNRHYIVLKAKIGDTIYVSDPNGSHQYIKSASYSVVKAAFDSGAKSTVYARPSGYDPEGWNGIKVTLGTPTNGSALASGSNSVTLTAKATNTSSKNVQLAFRIRKERDCTTAKTSVGPWTSLVTPGTTQSYKFTGLTKGVWYWSVKARDASGEYSSGATFCGSEGWASARYFVIE